MDKRERRARAVAGRRPSTSPDASLERARQSIVDRRHRSRALAALFAAGGLLSAMVVLLPGWHGMDEEPILATAVLAIVAALVLLTWAEQVGRLANSLFLVAGTTLIALAQALAGGGTASATYAILYVWVALHSAMFLSRWAVALHLALTTAAHAVVLVRIDEAASMAPRIALTLGTQIAACVVVGSMATHLRRLADTDALTGVGNRRSADQAVAWALTRSRRDPSQHTCIALLDLNDFKVLNDREGHPAGDRVLIDLARAWGRLLRPTDTLARTGGDEFMVVMPDCDLAQATEIVARLLAAPARVVVSAGLACWDGDELPSDLIARADRALYAAKADGPVVVASAPG